MKLLTQELMRTIPALYSQENEADPVCRVKFFMPDGAFTWYVIEGATREKVGCGWGVNCHHRPKPLILRRHTCANRRHGLGFFCLLGLECWSTHQAVRVL